MTLLLLLAALPVLLAAPPAAGVVVRSLDGDGWTVGNKTGSWPARVPGGVYTALRAAGVLDSDFFYERNDENFRWVSYVDWTYNLTFEVDSEMLKRDHVQLVLHGVDTVATVRLNGHLLGTTDNMFVRYVFPAKAALAAGENVLTVALTSAPREAQRRFDKHVALRGYRVPPDCLPDEYHGECHANHLRKMQASFAWDWGPAFPGSGIWKSVALEAFSTGAAVLRSVAPHYEPANGAEPPRLHVRAFFEAGAGDRLVKGTLSAALDLGLEGLLAGSKAVSCSPDARGVCQAEIVLRLDRDPTPLLWWPNGEGEQLLFPLTVTLMSADGEKSERVENVGLRTVRLVQEPVDPSDLSKGLTFYFEVNGRAIFAKGSNWIPASVFPELGYEHATVRGLLQAAKDAHMNMLRVWGGGVYESDLFYQLADEMGLLIWQDMMFACAMYPAEEAFLDSVREEVRQQVLRLAPRPSVALWAGNNENEGALVDNWYDTSTNFSLYKEDYIKLYVDTIRHVVLNLDPSRPFVVSSPSNGRATDEAGFVSNRPSNPLYGDVHYYNYLADGWSADTYELPRFASEYGFQSLPAVATLRAAVSAPSELAVSSPLLASRQHHPNGYAEMSNLVSQRFQLPDNWNTPEGYATFTYLNEMYQAVAIQTQTEHYRRLRNQTMADGRGRCMGALYWQLNDVWAAPTWASIDFAGRWKPLHYLATEFFAPIMASPYVDLAHRLHVWALNDRQEHVLRVVLQGRAGRWDALQPEKWTDLSKPFTLEAASSQQVLLEGVAPLLGRLEGCGVEAKRCFLLLRLIALPDGVQLGPLREVLPVPPMDAVGIHDPNITVTEVTEGLEVRLSASAPAPFVWLEAASIPGRFERNAFLLADGEARVRFLPAPGVAPPAPAALRRALTVASLPRPSQSAAAAAPAPDHLRASVGYVAALPSVVLAASAGIWWIRNRRRRWEWIRL